MTDDTTTQYYQEGGLLLVDKPKGWTSFDVVAKIRGGIKKRTGIKKPKVGHTGTLDPLATGLMIVVVGKYCKRAEEFSKLDKSYDVELTLGATSTTGDAEGDITSYSHELLAVSPDKDSSKGDSRLVTRDSSSAVHETTVVPTAVDVERVTKLFVGEIEQTPPIYSAIKINGQRAYDLARAGKAPEMKSRKVNIYSISDIKYDYPHVWFSASVSSGTYIRSLAVDIGEKLGTGAYMSALRRTKVGKYQIKDAKTVEELVGSDMQVIKEL